jgi:hypothetical protein
VPGVCTSHLLRSPNLDSIRLLPSLGTASNLTLGSIGWSGFSGGLNGQRSCLGGSCS